MWRQEIEKSNNCLPILGSWLKVSDAPAALLGCDE